MHQSSETRLRRFTKAEFRIHRLIALDIGLLIVTAAFLYIPALSSMVGNRYFFKISHVVLGFALPIPIIIAFCFMAFRLDVRRLNRFARIDWEWLRSKDRRSGRLAVGKFNAGQKLNAAFQFGAIIVMFVTGAMLWFNGLFSIDIRTGVTFVHDWLSLLVVLVVAGHIYMAQRDPIARQGLRTGFVPRDWAEREHRGWAQAMTGEKRGEQAAD
ncbi:MAG: cytochrome b/b6 domain-containing protein [Candidatus Nanopelagicales bacterium]